MPPPAVSPLSAPMTLTAPTYLSEGEMDPPTPWLPSVFVSSTVCSTMMLRQRRGGSIGRTSRRSFFRSFRRSFWCCLLKRHVREIDWYPILGPQKKICDPIGRTDGASEFVARRWSHLIDRVHLPLSPRDLRTYFVVLLVLLVWMVLLDDRWRQKPEEAGAVLLGNMASIEPAKRFSLLALRLWRSKRSQYTKRKSEWTN